MKRSILLQRAKNIFPCVLMGIYFSSYEELKRKDPIASELLLEDLEDI